MTEQKTYRHRKTGVVQKYPARFAANFPDLVEVAPGTKPLAYTPIPEARVQAAKAVAAIAAASQADEKPAEDIPADAAKAEEN